jgi:hypothetical protein
MTLEWLIDIGISEEGGGLIMERWETRETEYAEAAQKLREEMEMPIRAAGLVPGEGRDGLPETDSFLAGFNL